MTNDGEGRAAVACPRPSAPALSGAVDPWSEAERRPAGLALTRRVVCVVGDAPLTAATLALAEGGGSLGIPVVDGGHRLVGLLPRAAATLALLGPSPGALVGDHVTPTATVVRESDSLGEAFRTMGARHARELLVVSSERQIVGLLRDIDALQLVAASRRACA